MIVVAAKVSATNAIVGIIVIRIGIAPVIAVVEGIVPRIPPTIAPTAIIPAVRTVVPRIIQAELPAGVIPGIIPVIPALGAIARGRLQQQVAACLLITSPAGVVLGEAIIIETLYLLGNLEVFQRIGIDAQLAIEIYNIG